MKRALLVLVLAAAAAIAAWSEYRAVRADLGAQREAIRSEWSQVDLTIERRAELAGRMAELLLHAAPDAAAQAKELAPVRATLAAAATPEEKIHANQRLTVLLAGLQTATQQHPRIRSQDLLAQLSDADNRFAVERRRYNDMLEHYNAQIQRFPDNIVASLAGFSRDNAYFPTDALQ